MLKLRNAVLTALLAFCLVMPFVSCSFNDSATGYVSGKVKIQSVGTEEHWTVCKSDGTILYDELLWEEVISYASGYDLIEDTDYDVNYETYTITLTEAGDAKVLDVD